MIKHIVMWKMKEHAEGADKTVNAEKMLGLLEGLKDSISGIERLQVGTNLPSQDATHDIVLIVEFTKPEALDAYREHPEHEKVAEFIQKVTLDRAAVDCIQ